VIEREIGALEAELEDLQAAIEQEQQDQADWQRLVELTTAQGAMATRLEALMGEWEESMIAEEG
jgi:hypothetical protein